MGLADYQPETRVIDLKGGSFTVKGLSLLDVTRLVRYHLPDLEAMVDLGSKALDGRHELSEGDITKLAITFAEQAPGFTSNLIALASGDPSDAGVAGAGRLPFPVQVKALADIAELTFSEVGGIKKAWESVAGLLTKQGILKPSTATPR